MQKEVLSARQTVEEVFQNAISEWVLYDWVRKKKVPHIRVGGRVFFRRQSLLDWMAEQEAASLVAPGKKSKIRKIF